MTSVRHSPYPIETKGPARLGDIAHGAAAYATVPPVLAGTGHWSSVARMFALKALSCTDVPSPPLVHAFSACRTAQASKVLAHLA